MVQPLTARLGIMQGRLIPSATGALDAPPGDRWREEFALAQSLGLNHIELVAERAFHADNPIWTADGRAELRTLADEHGVEISSLCMNEPLDTPIDTVGFARELAPRLRAVVEDLPIDTIVIPLLDASDPTGHDHQGRVDLDPSRDALFVLHTRVAPTGARIAVETNLSADRARNLVVPAGDLGICYDVGNASAAGFDPAEELRSLDELVWHVHAKDKDEHGNNVRFGFGRVNFSRVGGALRDIGYEGLVTMEAVRGDDPVDTAERHIRRLQLAEKLLALGRSELT